MRHPAKYSAVLIPVLAQMCDHAGLQHIHDPFAGAGGIFRLRDHGFHGRITASELEPEWAAMHPETTVADALALPWPDHSFDAIATSPTYGNRMADSFTPGEGWDAAQENRNTYTHVIGRKLSANNSGQMQWGDEYRDFHRRAWLEAYRVIRLGGYLILNISDHVRAGQRMQVTQWHIDTLKQFDFTVIQTHAIPTRRQRRGQNGDIRTAHEYIIQFRKGDPTP